MEDAGVRACSFGYSVLAPELRLPEQARLHVAAVHACGRSGHVAAAAGVQQARGMPSF